MIEITNRMCIILVALNAKNPAAQTIIKIMAIMYSKLLMIFGIIL